MLTAPESADQARDALRDETDRPWPTSRCRPTEWERARSELAGGLLIGSQANAARVSRAQRDVMYGRGTDDLSRSGRPGARLRPAAELRDAAAHYLHADR